MKGKKNPILYLLIPLIVLIEIIGIIFFKKLSPKIKECCSENMSKMKELGCEPPECCKKMMEKWCRKKI